MSSCFLKSGDRFRVSTKESLNVYERLPVGTYKIGCCDGQFFLESIDSFSIKGKLYGNTDAIAKRILVSFQERPGGTGILLSGEKGSGKTMLARHISILAASAGGGEKEKIPTIVINKPYCGEEFNAFIQMIQQPVVVIFDEFEKVYSECSKQQALLTLLDGVYPSKKLYVFTCNTKGGLDVNMMNRPGRIYYVLEYHGVDENFIREYCEDNLKNKEHINMVCATARVFSAFNFDMLKALVEEMNRFSETPAQALKFLNIRAGFESRVSYAVKLIGADGKKNSHASQSWSGIPTSSAVWISDCQNGDTLATFLPSHLKGVDEKTGAFIFENTSKGGGAGQKLILTPTKRDFDIDFESVQEMKLFDDGTPSHSKIMKKAKQLSQVFKNKAK